MPDAARGESGDDARPAPRVFRRSWLVRAGDAVISPLVRFGLVPHTYLLTTRGRRTGQPRTNPVTLVEEDGRRWLVAPYGVVSWVKNARAAGRVTLRRGGRSMVCAIREVGAEEAAPILKRYLALTGPPRRYFRATKDDPVERFAAEAHAHPVFALTVLADGGGGRGDVPPG